MELVTITEKQIGEELVQTVNARELHGFLEIGKIFASWIQYQISRTRLIKNRDYITVQTLSTPNMVSSKSRPQVMIEYHLTIDSAKHVAMISGTEKGFEVREYFIACEKKLKEIYNQKLLSDQSERILELENMLEKKNEDMEIAFKAVMKQKEKIERAKIKVISLNETIQEQEMKYNELMEKCKPALSFLKRYVNSEETQCISDVARILGWQPKELFNLLSADKIIFKRNCIWVPAQKYVNNGLFVINVTQKGYHQTRVTSRGILWISKNYL